MSERSFDLTTLWSPFGVATLLLTIALLLAFSRLVRGPTVPDRVISLDLMASLVVGLLLLTAAQYTILAIVDIALVLALLAFLGTVAFASLIERRTRR